MPSILPSVARLGFGGGGNDTDAGLFVGDITVEGPIHEWTESRRRLLGNVNDNGLPDAHEAHGVCEMKFHNLEGDIGDWKDSKENMVTAPPQGTGCSTQYTLPKDSMMSHASAVRKQEEQREAIEALNSSIASTYGAEPELAGWLVYPIS